jgi:predicted permease
MSLGASTLPRLDAVSFDATVLLFAVAALFVSGVFVGFAPALRLARTDVKTLMNESGRSSTGGRATARWLTSMTVAEIALAITLVAGAGWLIRSFANLRMTDPGFTAEHRMVFDVSLTGQRFQQDAARVAGLQDLLSRIRGVAGVAAVAATTNFPLRPSFENSLLLHFEGEAFDAARPKGARQRFITPGFLQAAGVDLVAGRDFSLADRPDGARVVLVNRTFVDRYLPGRDPLGARFSFGYPTIFPETDSTIVGVVEDVRQNRIVEPGQPAFYSPIGQGFVFPRLAVVVQTKAEDVAAVQTAIRSEVRQFEPTIAVDFEPVTDLVASTLRRQELGMTLMLLFGGVAVALAAVGIYGVVAYAAAQRRGEVATRLALGASPASVFWLVLRQGVVLAAVGAVIGLMLAFLAGRIVAANLHAVQAVDPLILSGAVAVVVVITLLATMVPAFRASRLNPSHVLRSD